MAKLDEDFIALAQTEAFRSLSHPSKMNASKGESKEESIALRVKESGDKVCMRFSCSINPSMALLFPYFIIFLLMALYLFGH